jgi:hypothetical protein
LKIHIKINQRELTLIAEKDSCGTSLQCFPSLCSKPEAEPVYHFIQSKSDSKYQQEYGDEFWEKFLDALQLGGTGFNRRF